MDTEKIIIGVVGAIIGLISGLATPWVKSYFDRKTELIAYRTALIRSWRTEIDKEIELPLNFGDSSVYAALRAHMNILVIKQFEAPRTVYVSGGRGTNVRKQMLTDEISRIEKDWKLV